MGDSGLRLKKASFRLKQQSLLSQKVVARQRYRSRRIKSSAGDRDIPFTVIKALQLSSRDSQFS